MGQLGLKNIKNGLLDHQNSGSPPSAPHVQLGPPLLLGLAPWVKIAQNGPKLPQTAIYWPLNIKKKMHSLPLKTPLKQSKLA